MTRALVLGGGMVGSAMVMDLAEHDEFEVTVADVRPEALQRLRQSHGVKIEQADLSDPAEVRRLDETQLRQLLILSRGLLLTSEDPVVEIDGIPGMPTIRYRQKTVRCGKATCTACPHGPYWYAHWTEEGRRRSRYIGSELPAEVRRKLDDLDRQRVAASNAASNAATEAASVEGVVAVTASGDGAGPATARRALRLVPSDR